MRRTLGARVLGKVRALAKRRHKPLVDFVVAGAQKSGTSAMNAYLADHPGVSTATTKEVHFFDTDRHFAGLWPDYSHYHSFFGPASAGQRVGEATPVYMYWEPAPRRMWEYNPDMRVIIMLRNPVERAYSHWNMERSLGREELPFIDAIRAETSRARAARPNQDKYFAYVDRGLYCAQLRRLSRFFPEDQMLVLRYDDFSSHPDEALTRVTEFLGIAPLADLPEKKVYVGRYDAAMSVEAKNVLMEIFDPEIRSLEQLLGWDLAAWRS